MSKISELSDGGALQSTDYLIAVRSGGNVKVQLSELPSGIDTGGNIEFGDNEKAIFGAGSDLEIYHSGTHSIINETGTGELKIQATNLRLQSASGGENYLTADLNGAVRIYYDDAQKFQTTSSGIDVTGTVTADGYTFDSEGQAITFITSSAPRPSIKTGDITFTNGLQIDSDNGLSLTYDGNDNLVGGISIKRGSALKAVFLADQNGDISFYEDTGTTAKLAWSASNERLTLSGSDYQFGIAQGANQPWYLRGVSDGGFRLHLNGTGDILTASSAGNVGIGHTSPGTPLDVNGAIRSKKVGGSAILYLNNGTTQHSIQNDSNALVFYENAIEAMRIDTSGNLLVGTTDASPVTSNVNGIALKNNGQVQFSYAGTGVAMNRKGSDGNIIDFRKDGTTVGSIGSRSGNLFVQFNTGQAVGFTGTTTASAILPAVSGAVDDGNIALGTGATRFKDLYLSGGVYAGSYASFVQGGGNDLFITNTYASGDLVIDSGRRIIFKDSGTEAMRLDSSGNLLVGETSFNPYSGLTTAHVFKGFSDTGGAAPFGIYNADGAANCPVLNLLNRDSSTDTTVRFLQFYSNVTSTTNQAMGGIVGNGANNVQFATISDAREKTNIQSIGGSLEKINALNPVEFDWIASGEHVNAGFVAQEVEQVFPEFVVENMAGEGQEARKGLTGGMTSGIVAHLVKAIQEQQEIINDLRARVAQLEGA